MLRCPGTSILEGSRSRASGSAGWRGGRDPMIRECEHALPKAKQQGFRARMRTHSGRKMINRKRRRGRHKVSVC